MPCSSWLFAHLYSGEYLTRDYSDFNRFNTCASRSSWQGNDAGEGGRFLRHGQIGNDESEEDHADVDNEEDEEDNDEFLPKIDRYTEIDRMQLPLTVLDAMRQIEAAETILEGKQKTTFKKIGNHQNTCYFNTTLQLCPLLPFIRESIANYLSHQGDACNHQIHMIGESLAIYDSAIQQLQEFPIEIIGCFQMDISDNLNGILTVLGDYGITTKMHQIITLSVVASENDKSITSLESIIQKAVGDDPFEMTNPIFFRKIARLPI